ncbi:MAG TPA: SpoIIE family protein phosphatase [Terriglobales bacterium]|nr:SpoIIE family protein phosphatase [Terriglobales bacterium]
MSTPFYRLLRRKVAIWTPKSMLARLSVYIFLLRLAVYVFQVLLRTLGRTSAADYLNGLAVILSFVLGSLLIVLLLRWVRNEMLWRLRNRLIVTYVFIGVIPVLLILTMVGIAGYMFSNQYVTSEVRVDLEKEIRSLEVVAQGIAPELSGPGAKREDLRWKLRLSNLERRFPGLEVTGWQKGKTLRLHNSTEAHAKPPDWIKEDFQGLIGDAAQLFLCAVVKGPDGTLVMFRVPLNKGLVERSSAGLGQVRYFNLLEVAGKSRRSGLVISEKDDDPNGKNVNYEVAQEPLVVGGIVPPHGTLRYDPELSYVNPVPIVEWDSGKTKNVAITVITRPSALVNRLFIRTGQLGTVLLTVLAGIAVFFGLIVIIALFFGVGLTRTVTLSVYNLYKATQEINRGNLKHRIPVKSKDQLAELQNSFNSMAENLEKLIQEQKEKERLESEIAIAQEVQATLFPREAASIEGLEVHGVCKPARSVSGDYYDFLPAGKRMLGLAVGDISGKGISAALLMATVHSAVRAYEFGRMPTRQELVHAGAASTSGLGDVTTDREWVVSGGMQSPAIALELLNRHLYHSTQPEKYATLFLSVYDAGSRTLTYSNAGHLPPVIIGQDGSVRRLEIGGTVIGLFDEVTYEESHVVLRPNDIFVAFSDGITEPENEFGEFGEDRLIDLIRANRSLPLARISEIVTTAVQDWIGAEEQPDDVTLVLARAL